MKTRLREAQVADAPRTVPNRKAGPAKFERAGSTRQIKSGPVRRGRPSSKLYEYETWTFFRIFVRGNGRRLCACADRRLVCSTGRFPSDPVRKGEFGPGAGQ